MATTSPYNLNAAHNVGDANFTPAFNEHAGAINDLDTRVTSLNTGGSSAYATAAYLSAGGEVAAVTAAVAAATTDTTTTA